MVSACALCKGKNPRRTHMFPQNSRAEVQLKWMKALGLPSEQEEAVLAEMRLMEQKGSRPRWCSFHFEYDDAGIHFPKYFDPEEGKTAQGWTEDDDKDDDDEEQGPSTKEGSADTESSMPSERRRSTRKRGTADTPSTSADAPVISKSLQKILRDAGISVPDTSDDDVSSPQKTSSSSSRQSAKKGATAVEKTLQDILMGAGLPVPETLQAKTGVKVAGGGGDTKAASNSSPRRSKRAIQAAVVASAAASGGRNLTVADAKRMGTFVPGTARPGGTTMSNPKYLINPLAAKYAFGDFPKILVPKAGTGGRLPVQCFNHNTMEKYDDSDSLRHFKMPCQKDDCRSELTVIMNRARALEDQFDEMTNCVLNLVQMYQKKTPQAWRPQQSLATIQGRAASVAGPVYGKGNVPLKHMPDSSLATQERSEKRARLANKEPQRLLTSDDLASSARRRANSNQDGDSEEDDEEEDDDSGDGDSNWNPSSPKRIRLTRTSSKKDVDTSEASEASPPTLEMIE